MTQADLPLLPEPQRDDVVPGPRVPARYGSYATALRRSTREWRILGYGDPLTWPGRWRSVDDYSEIDCLIGKWGRTASLEGLIFVDPVEGGVLEIDGWPIRPDTVTVVEDGVHFNAFQRALRLYDAAGRHAGAVASVLGETRRYRDDAVSQIRATGGVLRASLLREFGWTEADLETP